MSDEQFTASGANSGMPAFGSAPSAAAPSNTGGSNGDEHASTAELDPVALQLQQLEDERRKLEELQAEVDLEEDEHKEGKEEVDARSIYVGNVEYAARPEDLEKHFQPAGAVNRVNIMLNKMTGQPKGFAYIEFAEPAMVAEALLLNGTEFFGRPLKVLPKRTNIPGLVRGRGRGRGGRGGRGARGAGRGYRGGYRGRARGYSPY